MPKWLSTFRNLLSSCLLDLSAHRNSCLLRHKIDDSQPCYQLKFKGKHYIRFTCRRCGPQLVVNLYPKKFIALAQNPDKRASSAL